MKKSFHLFLILANLTLMCGSRMFGQEKSATEKIEPIVDNADDVNLLKSIEELQRSSGAVNPPPKGIAPPLIHKETEQASNPTQLASTTGVSMLKLLNVALNEFEKPAITFDMLEHHILTSDDQQFFVLFKVGGADSTPSELSDGHFIRFNESNWYSWRPSQNLEKTDIKSGLIRFSLPDRKFLFFYNDPIVEPPIGVAMKTGGRYWSINFSREDCLSPMIPIVPSELFYHGLK